MTALAVLGLVLAVGAGAALIALALLPAVFIYIWRAIYPWLVRMGRWAAQLRNLIALFFAVLIWGFLLGLIFGGLIGVPTLATLGVILGMVIFFFLFFLGIMVWLVRLWRYVWPPWRLGFWDVFFRIVALGWLILKGILVGVSWLFYHPLRWLVATLLFYLRRISAAAAWILYHPPVRWLITADLFIMRLIARPAVWILYYPPIRWVAEVVIFILRLMARIFSAIVYGILSLLMRIVNGAREVLKRGLAAEKNSYQEYKYAHGDDTGAA
jgi:hypothetical protein